MRGGERGLRPGRERARDFVGGACALVCVSASATLGTANTEAFFDITRIGLLVFEQHEGIYLRRGRGAAAQQ